jgi:hypothetical protein
MGKVKGLWEEERQKRWQSHYNDYVNSIDPARMSATTIDAASTYADEMMEEEDAEKDGPI